MYPIHFPFKTLLLTYPFQQAQPRRHQHRPSNLDSPPRRRARHNNNNDHDNSGNDGTRWQPLAAAPAPVSAESNAYAGELPVRTAPANADIPSRHDLGPANIECKFCGAFHWIAERLTKSTANNPIFSLCCKEGDVNLPQYKPLPQYLRNLLLSNGQRNQQFRDNLRAYNCALAFTSIDCTPTNHGVGPGGSQCFQIHGELYHLQGPLEPAEGAVPKYAQLYIYDPAYASAVCSEANFQLDPMVL